jgi:hypothetical protein
MAGQFPGKRGWWSRVQQLMLSLVTLTQRGSQGG